MDAGKKTGIAAIGILLFVLPITIFCIDVSGIKTKGAAPVETSTTTTQPTPDDHTTRHITNTPTTTPHATDPETAATEAVTSIFTWQPATDPDPTTALVRTQPLVATDVVNAHLNGWNQAMLVTPDQWSTWKQAGLSPTGTVTLSPEDTPPATDTTAFYVHDVHITIPATIPTQRHYTTHTTVTKQTDGTWHVTALTVTNQEGHSL